jgi:iron(III) transport system ATP-binding protein
MLKIEHLRKEFRGSRRGESVVAVADFALDMEPGEFVSLLGPSGCGKTTTLRCIAGLERANRGEISVGDRVVYSSSNGVFVPPNQRQIGMVFQSYAIWPHMNVFENVAFPLRVQKQRYRRDEIQERVQRVLDVVGLGDLPARYATQLSGGQQQRLALARALVIQPDLLLLDEPLSNLDAKLRESLRFELKRLQREQGITTVYVTHDQTEALSLSNRIVVMSAGEIMQVGKPFDIYLRPQARFVADFVGTTNFLPGKLHEVDHGRAVVETPIGKVLVDQFVGVDTGDTCTISVRPEHIDISQPADPGAPLPENHFDATVDTRLFVGESMDYQLALGDTRIRAKGATGNRVSTGETVRIHLPSDHCVALPFGE